MGVKQPNSLRVIIDLETEIQGDSLHYFVLGVSVDGKKITPQEGSGWETIFTLFDDIDNEFKLDLIGGTY